MAFLIPLASAAYGIYSSARANSQREKSEKKLEDQANKAQPNQSIMDFYNKALSKYNVNPYESVSYKQQSNQIGRNLATGLNAAQNRRQGLGSIGGLVQQANDASARAAGNAESMQGQDLRLLGGAAGAKTAEEQKRFDMLYNLNALKAGQAASTQNSGISNIYSGLSTAAYLYGGGNNGGIGGYGGNTGSGGYRMQRTAPYNPDLLPYRSN